MWTYNQSGGALFDRLNVLCAIGYSGKGIYKNDPVSESIPFKGPIPRGFYKIGDPQDSGIHGPYALPLEPAGDNEMFGRDEFLIHGERTMPPAGEASEGCIILDHATREKIIASGDRLLEVVA